jgi:hypothetical protein
MNAKKAYPLRINAEVLDCIQHWADDELRSLNAQIEYVLRDALRRSGRMRGPAAPADAGADAGPDAPSPDPKAES